MAENTAKNNGNGENDLIWNAAIGFLALLLIILIAALVTRFIYPRIVNQRAENQSHLISNIIQVEVLNGCGIPGIANTYTGVLRNNGFDVVETGNFDHFNLQNTLVIGRTNVKDNAYRVADALGIAPEHVLIESSPDFYLDVTIVIGHDYESLNEQ